MSPSDILIIAALCTSCFALGYARATSKATIIIDRQQYEMNKLRREQK